jgi:hypothetical protein
MYYHLNPHEKSLNKDSLKKAKRANIAEISGFLL